MEKALDTSSARPSWLADGQPNSAAPSEPAAARKEVPWRTPDKRQARPAPAPAPRPAAVAAPPAQPKRRRHLWENHILPLVFLLIFVLVVGGYLAGWHFG